MPDLPGYRKRLHAERALATTRYQERGGATGASGCNGRAGFWSTLFWRTPMESGAGTVLYETTLRPNPPMRPAVLFSVLLAVAAINLAFAALFLLHGAWPVTPFMGADVALLAWAFQASRKAARRREVVCLTRNLLRVERYLAPGQSARIEFNPYWVRVELKEPVESSTRLTLRSHGRAVQIGNFLPPPQKLSVARALRDALQRAREPSFR